MKTIQSIALAATAGACLLLTGCTTAQTLVSQFSDVPLPERVARQRYGTCPNCARYPQPNCVDCRRIQIQRRDAAGLSNKAFMDKYGKMPPSPTYQNNGYRNSYRNGGYNNGGYSNGYNNGYRSSKPSTRGNGGYIVPASGRYSSQGNPFPARWFNPYSFPEGVDPATKIAILNEQIRRVQNDPELAADFLAANRTQKATSDEVSYAYRSY